MKLKGKAVDKLPTHKREKMERTLDRMERVRRNDKMFLRKTMEEKLLWARAERNLGVDTVTGLRNQIKSIENQIDRVQEQMLKLDGIILVLEDILAADRKETEMLAKQIEEQCEKVEDGMSTDEELIPEVNKEKKVRKIRKKTKKEED
jgi:hypothetical protein